MPNWRRLLLQFARFAFSLARDSDGKSIAARMAIMAMTTNSSINVNARHSGLPAGNLFLEATNRQAWRMLVGLHSNNALFSFQTRQGYFKNSAFVERLEAPRVEGQPNPGVMNLGKL